MPFAYVSGDPNNLVGGNPAAMTDIQGPFFDLAAYLNSSALADLAKGLLVIGELRWMAVAVGPAGWLKCDGTAYSRSTYAALFNALGGPGSPYGLGDGTSTFNVPDLTGRVAVGTGKSAGSTLTNRVAGQKYGNEAEVLSAAQIAAHNHTMSAGGAHAHQTGPSDQNLDHSHTFGGPHVPYGPAGGIQNQVMSQGAGNNVAINTIGPWTGGTSGTGAVIGPAALNAHTHGIASSGAHAHAIDNTGGGGSHPNVPPSLAVPAYIYAGA